MIMNWQSGHTVKVVDFVCTCPAGNIPNWSERVAAISAIVLVVLVVLMILVLNVF